MFNDGDLKRLKGNLVNFGVNPGIDICNYFDEVYEIDELVKRLEAAEEVCFHAGCGTLGRNQIRLSLKAWRKAAGK